MATRRIALSFDDAPTQHGGLLTPAQRTERLLESLRRARVERTVFFCNSSKLTLEGQRRLLAYQSAGHAIANHGHRHLDLHRVGAAAFVEDIRLADRQLARFRSFRRWFRFPMLHEGRTVEERDAVRRALKAMGYLAGYVTVDNYEWYLDLLARRAVKAGRKLDLSRLGKLYLPALLGPLAFYDEIARRVLKRAPAHVLLLHENDLAALFVGDLVAALRRAGWGIIHPDEAYRDPIAALEPATLFNGQGRIAALARAAGYRGVLGHASESTRYWERVFPSVVLR